MLTYTHRHSVDVIYIDPPYNTGAKDWKYNNDYVGSDDAYRHSKWLSFIERRLQVARELLNPADSVLIVTIDEKEYLRLGLLLEQTFPEARIQMVTSVINPASVARANSFGRAEEYIYFVQFGESCPAPLALGVEWKTNGKVSTELLWRALLRGGTSSHRRDRPNQFYPVFIRDTDAGPVFHSVGEPFFGADFRSIPVPDGCDVIWPIRSDGEEGRWQVGAESLQELIRDGFVKLGKYRGSKTTISYLADGERGKVQSGKVVVEGRDNDGSLLLDYTNYEAEFVPGTVWQITSHFAAHHGSSLLRSIIPGRRFPYPKSLYAVEDALRFFVKRKPEAVVLDFFAGSGTTAHAIMRLNQEDGGRRQSISVTNNEVSAEEEKRLRTEGLRPADPDWEKWGICEYITKPRITAAITGKTPEGEAIKGSYRYNNEFPFAQGLPEKAIFFKLTYEDPLSVKHNRAFERIAPMLWMRAGSRGEIIKELGIEGWAVGETYAILSNLDNSAGFLQAVSAAAAAVGASAAVVPAATLTHVFVVTDDNSAFQMICQELPDRLQTIQLYESYLHNFEINPGKRL